jgi:hypothetical protein
MNNIFGWSFECQYNKLIPAVFNDLNDFMSSVETAADLEGIPHRQYVVGLTSITDIATVHNQIKDKLRSFLLPPGGRPIPCPIHLNKIHCLFSSDMNPSGNPGANRRNQGIKSETPNHRDKSLGRVPSPWAEVGPSHPRASIQD